MLTSPVCRYGPGMDAVLPDSSRLRRVPQQSRSRDRVEKILNIAAEQVVSDGVDALGTRSIARAAGIPVASLYQYFADKDDILLALVERDVELMDEHLMSALEGLTRFDLTTIVETVVGTFVHVLPTRPSFIMIWLRGRSNQAIRAYCREHNRRMADSLFAFGAEHGLLTEEATPRHLQIALEVGDRLFQMAYEDTLEGDPMILDEAPQLVCAYLDRFATDVGRGLTTA